MMNRLLSPTSVAATDKPNAPSSKLAEEPVKDDATARTAIEHPPGNRPTVPSATESPAESGSLRAEQDSNSLGKDEATEIDDRALRITPAEAAFADHLFGLIPTPRVAKRFVNIYRMLKASVPGVDVERYEGPPGEFQVPMLLLAILLSAPEHAPELLRSLEHPAAEDRDMIDELKKALSAETFAGMPDKIDAIEKKSKIPDTAAIFKDWLPRVGRFSIDFRQNDRGMPASKPTIAPAAQASK